MGSWGLVSHRKGFGHVRVRYVTYVQRHARAARAARAKREKCMLYVDWRCTVVAVEKACDNVGKLLANIVADAPMGKSEVEIRRFVRRVGEGVERILRRVSCC